MKKYLVKRHLIPFNFMNLTPLMFFLEKQLIWDKNIILHFIYLHCPLKEGVVFVLKQEKLFFFSKSCKKIEG